MSRAVIFDFGNVVAFFDHRRATRRFAVRSTMAEPAMLSAIYDGQLEHDFESGRLSGDAFVTRVTDLIGYCGGRDEFIAEFVDIFTPNPRVIELIPRLQPRYRVGLGSNTNTLHSAFFRRQFADLFAHFDGLGLSHDAGVRKPAAGFYAYCAAAVDTPPERCVFVDDLAINVAAAEAVGMKAIHYLPDADLPAELRRHGIEVPA